MIKQAYKSLGWMLLLTIVYYNSYSQNVFATIQSKITNHLLADENDLSLAKTVIGYLPQQQSNGSWADIDYSNTAITLWEPAKHLGRIKYFALAFIKPGNIYYNNSDVFNAIVKALRYWYMKDPKSSNWWHNEIATPQTLGEIIIILHQGNNSLPISLQDSLVTRMKRGDVIKQTGANKLDVAIHYLYRACITKNSALMDTAVSQAFQPIMFTTGEGLQFDYSYLQHGPQLQISCYGLMFLSGEYRVASWLSGTGYALSGDKLKMLNHFFTNTFLPAIRGSYIDFNTEGRSISRPNTLDKKILVGNRGINSLMEIVKTFSGNNKEFLNAAIGRIDQTKSPAHNISSLHSYFWKGDYTQHLRPAYSFNVRTVSDRTRRTETGNKENKLGKFLPDGSTNIQRSGAEYYNIMPVWEWGKIPGITCRDFTRDQPTTVQWGEVGSTSFVGGVSDSVYGASAYDLNYDSVKAKKAWFFFDKEVVSMGAGINSLGTENVISTVNQCWLNGKVVANEDGKINDIKKEKNSKGFRWVWHDSIGYFFPVQADVTISNQLQKGSWNLINDNYSKDEVSGKVFKMWFNHGVEPKNGSYVYITVPGINAEGMNRYNQKDVMILANTDSVQAVQHAALKIIQAVFYKAGIISGNDISISVDKPCIVLVKNTDNKLMSFSIADPTQQNKEVVVTIKSKVKNNEKKIVCSLPTGNFAGSTAQFLVY